MADVNPYAAPRSQVDDVPVAEKGNFIATGRAVPAGYAWNWIAGGWELFKKQPGTWIGLFVVWAVIFIALGMVPLLGAIATNALFPVFGAGIIIGTRTLAQGGKLELAHLFAGFKRNTGNLVVVGLLFLVAMFAAAIPAIAIVGIGFFKIFAGMGSPAAAFGKSLGTFALAWLIWLSLMVPVYMAIWFAPALVALHDCGPGEALRHSFGACLKNTMPFLVYGIVLLMLFFVGSIPLGLGLLIVIPVTMASVYTSYRDIFFGD